MGPSTGRRRLRLLRQTGDELVAGVEQFLLVDDVVAVEDGAARVAGQAHGNPFGDAGADQGAGGGAAVVVKEAGRHAGRLTGRALGARPWSAASARPVAACATIADGFVPVGLDAIRGAPTGGVRLPPPPPARDGEPVPGHRVRPPA